jgi:hypothetical protein
VPEAAAAKGAVPPEHFAPLCRLWVQLQAAGGRDPVPLVAGLVAKSFEGRHPLLFAQRLLEEWSAPWWTRTSLARLRVLLCERAFEAGFEVHNLLDAGRNAPALGTVLATDEPRPLGALRLLWSLRAQRPWDRLGDGVETAFDVAADVALGDLLGEQRDLLLHRRDKGSLVGEGDRPPAPAVFRLTAVGAYLQGVLFRVPPRAVELRTLRPTGEGRMRLDGDEFRSPHDLEPLSRQLERWFRYAFGEFLPGIDRAQGWRSPDRDALLRAWGAVTCPECGRAMLPRAGEVGVAPGGGEGAGESSGRG